jgi:hypothetical protein
VKLAELKLGHEFIQPRGASRTAPRSLRRHEEGEGGGDESGPEDGESVEAGHDADEAQWPEERDAPEHEERETRIEKDGDRHRVSF